jgi:hypothetical protein
MIRNVARLNSPSEDPGAIPSLAGPGATNTKWWVRKDPPATPTSIQYLQTPIGIPAVTAISEKCPAYAAGFKPGIYGYISLSPSYDNMMRSGAGKNFPSVGYIEVGGWVKILDFPTCTDDGYVWLNVESAGSSSSWTAGGHRNTQWVIPCSNPNKKCTREKQSLLPTMTPEPGGSKDLADGCVSDRLAVGQGTQVSPADLLVVRAEPYTGRVLGHIPPAVVVTVIDGPKCKGGAMWWRLTSAQISGWAVENLLKSCPQEGECKPWE